MFTQDHGRDFDALLGQTEPLCLVRFGDGEIALIDGNAHQSADAWKVSGPTWLRGNLVDSLRHNGDRWCVGLPPPCCLRTGVRIHPAVRVPTPQRTFATLFLHANLYRVQEVLERFASAIVVGSWFGDIRVPEDGVSKQWDVDSCVAEIMKADRDVLLAAGPCSNIIALKYWQKISIEKRRFMLDVGSALDVHHGRMSRHFHDSMADHHCAWSGPKPESNTPRPPQVDVRNRTIRPHVPPPPKDPIRAEAPRAHVQERGRVRAEPLGRATKIGKRP